MSEINDCVNCSLIQMHINLKYMGLLFNDDDTYNNTYIEKYGFNCIKCATIISRNKAKTLKKRMLLKKHYKNMQNFDEISISPKNENNSLWGHLFNIKQ